jgi:hypothetical protein
MTGMLTGDRMVRLEVAGICQQSIAPTSNYTVTVPYGSMSKTMQSVSRMGGKIVGVQISDRKTVTSQAETVRSTASEDNRSDEKSSNNKRKKR